MGCSSPPADMGTALPQTAPVGADLPSMELDSPCLWILEERNVLLGTTPGLDYLCLASSIHQLSLSCRFFFLFCFDTGSLYVVLATLELAL